MQDDYPCECGKYGDRCSECMGEGGEDYERDRVSQHGVEYEDLGWSNCKHCNGTGRSCLLKVTSESFESAIQQIINETLEMFESIERGGEKFSGYNKPKRTPKHPTKSHAVLAKDGSRVKLIRFGQKGVSGAGKHPTTPKEKKRRKSFKARHAKNIKKGKMSAAYWSNRVKWE